MSALSELEEKLGIKRVDLGSRIELPKFDFNPELSVEVEDDNPETNKKSHKKKKNRKEFPMPYIDIDELAKNWSVFPAEVQAWTELLYSHANENESAEVQDACRTLLVQIANNEVDITYIEDSLALLTTKDARVLLATLKRILYAEMKARHAQLEAQSDWQPSFRLPMSYARKRF